jgi:hypothetical protein
MQQILRSKHAVLLFLFFSLLDLFILNSPNLVSFSNMMALLFSCSMKSSISIQLSYFLVGRLVLQFKRVFSSFLPLNRVSIFILWIPCCLVFYFNLFLIELILFFNNYSC